MGARTMRTRHLAATVAGALLVLALPASAPSSRLDDEITIELTTSGPGTLTITPAQDAPQASCKTIAQQPDFNSDACVHQFAEATRVTLEAVPDNGRTFAGWSDFACRKTSRRCTLNLTPGTRYVSAQFSPVRLQLYIGQRDPPGDQPYGRISIKPKPSKPCAPSDFPQCEYPLGATVELTREFAAPGYFWIGACEGNREGRLDANVCRLRLTSDEAIGAGFREAGEIPPPLGSGIVVVVSGRGKVTGTVVRGTQTLDCGTSCLISGLTRYDYVKLKATAQRGSHFSRWNVSKLNPLTVPLSSVNRVQAVFVKN